MHIPRCYTKQSVSIQLQLWSIYVLTQKKSESTCKICALHCYSIVLAWPGVAAAAVSPAAIRAHRIIRRALLQLEAGRRRRRRCTRQGPCWARGWQTLARPPPSRPSGRCPTKVSANPCFSLSFFCSLCTPVVTLESDTRYTRGIFRGRCSKLDGIFIA